jgi:hypothetical protein
MIKFKQFLRGGGLSKSKAREILHDKRANGKPLTDKQRKFFGAVASGYIKYDEGGEIEDEREEEDDDKEMVEGIADILRQVRSMKNRRQIAKNMIKDFEDENVEYNKNRFLSMAKIMQQGGLSVGTTTTIFPTYESQLTMPDFSEFKISSGFGARTKPMAGSSNMLENPMWKFDDKTGYFKMSPNSIFSEPTMPEFSEFKVSSDFGVRKKPMAGSLKLNMPENSMWKFDPKTGYLKRTADDILSEPTVPEFPEFKKGGGIPERYKNMGFTKVGVKKESNRPGKKWMVLAKKGEDYKVVHGGYKGMKDYTQHGSEERRKRFWDRMGGKNSSKAKDPFSPLYWHKRFGTWQQGGEIPEDYNGYLEMVNNLLSNLPIYSPDARYPEYQTNVQDWQNNLKNLKLSVNPELVRTFAGKSPAMYVPYDQNMPSPLAIYPYQGNVVLSNEGYDDINNMSRVLPHEIIHGAFDGTNFIPEWLGSNLYRTARNPESFEKGDHKDLMTERAASLMQVRNDIIRKYNLPQDSQIPRNIFNDYMKGYMNQYIKNAKTTEPNDLIEALQSAGDATQLFNLINMQVIPE